eukprot:TCONS_00018723-protein
MLLYFLLLNILPSTMANEPIDWEILGLFTMTNCQPGFEHHCLDAQWTAESFLVERENKEGYDEETVKKRFRSKYFCIIDMKDSMEAVNNFALPFIEHPVTNTSGMCSHGNASTIYHRKTTLIFTYMSHEITRSLGYLLLNEEIPLLAATWKQMYPNHLLEHPLYVFSHESSFLVDTQFESTYRVLKSINVTYSAIFYMREYKQDDEISKRNCTERKNSAFCYLSSFKEGEEGKQCIKEIFVDYKNETKMNATVALVKSYKNLRNIYIYGLSTSYFELEKTHPVFKDFSTPEAKNDFFLTPFTRPFNNETATYQSLESSIERNKHYKSFQNVPGGRLLWELLWFATQFQYIFIQGDPEVLQGLGHIMPMFKGITTDEWLNIDIGVREILMRRIASNRETMKVLLKILKADSYFKEREVKDWETTYYFNPVRQMNKSEPFCNLTKPQCGKGEELIHGFYEEQKWLNSLGWFCQKCQKGFYKEVEGNDKCGECFGFYETNFERTTCFDPYQDQYIKMDQLDVVLISSLVYILILLIIFTMIIFVKLRETPIVKNANRMATYFQLSAHLILAAVPQIVFTEKPSALKCCFRPIIVGLCLTAVVSVNLAKTQKLNVIFRLKTRLSGKKKKAIGLLEWLIIAFLIFVDILILIWNYSFNPAEVIEVHHVETKLKDITCQNNASVVIQLFFVLLLVLANGVQAFRARKLPSHFTETTHVIYSSFTTVLLIAASTGIYFAQKSFNVKDRVLWISIHLLNALNFLLIYIYKMFVMLFKPEQNTSQAFNKKRTERINSKFQH